MLTFLALPSPSSASSPRARFFEASIIDIGSVVSVAIGGTVVVAAEAFCSPFFSPFFSPFLSVAALSPGLSNACFPSAISASFAMNELSSSLESAVVALTLGTPLWIR